MNNIKNSRFSLLYKVVFCVSLLYILGLGIYKTGLVQKYLKYQLEHILSTAFRREITSEGVTGSLFTQLLMHNVKIASESKIQNGVFLELESLNAKFDIYKAFKEFSFMAGLETVNLVNGTMIIERINNDNWNLLDFAIPPKKPGNKKSNNKFRGAIFLNNIRGKFIDSNGWGEAILESPFIEEFTDLSGYMDFSDFSNVPMQFTANIKRTGSPISLNGTLDAYFGEFELFNTVSYLDTTHWGSYLIPVDSVRLFNDGLSIFGTLYKTKDNKSLNYNYKIYVDNIGMDIKQLDQPIQEIKGVFEFSNENDYKMITLKNLKGVMSDGDIQANGRINIDQLLVDIELDIAKNDIFSVLSVFSFLNQYDWIKGSLGGSVNMKGNLKKPTFKGSMTASDLTLYNLETESLNFDYQLKDQVLTLMSNDSQSELTGGIDFSSKVPILDVALVHNWELSLPNSINSIVSSKNISLLLESKFRGNTSLLSITIDAKINDFLLLGSDISNVYGDFELRKLKKLQTNNTVLKSKNNEVIIYVKGRNDFKHQYNYEVSTQTDLKSGNQLSLKLRNGPEKLFSDLFDHNLDLKLNWTNGILNNQSFKSLDIDMSISSELMSIDGRYEMPNDTYFDLLAKINKDKSGMILLSSQNLNESQFLVPILKESLLPDDFVQLNKLDINLLFSGFSSFKVLPKKYSGDINMQLGQSKIYSQELDFANMKMVVSNEKWQLNQFKAQYNQSIVNGNINNLLANEMFIVIDKQTLINSKDINPIYNPLPEWLGDFSLNGIIGLKKQNQTLALNSIRLNVRGTDISSPIERLDIFETSINGNVKEMAIDRLIFKSGKQEVIGNGRLSECQSLSHVFIRKKNDCEVYLDLELNNINLESLGRWVSLLRANKETNNLFKNTNRFIIPSTSDNMLYHYKNLSMLDEFLNFENKWNEFEVSSISYMFSNLSGVLNGDFKINKKNEEILARSSLLVTNMVLKDLSLKNSTIDMDLKNDTLSSSITLSDTTYNRAKFESIDAEISYKLNTDQLIIKNTRWETPELVETNPISYNGPVMCIINKSCNNESLEFKLTTKNSRQIWELYSNSTHQVVNNGSLSTRVKGPIKSPVIDGEIEFDTFLVKDIQDGKLVAKVKDTQLLIKENRLKKFDLDISFFDKKDVLNQLNSYGSLTILTKDWIRNGISLIPKLSIRSENLVLNTKQFQDTNLSNIELQIGKAKTKNAYFMISGGVDIDSGQFVMGSPRISSSERKMDLDIMVNIASKYRITGGLIGGGRFTFANNYYFETDSSQIKVQGTSDAPDFIGSIPLKLGAITLFDSFYEVLSNDNQKYFQEASSFERKTNEIVIQKEYFNNKMYLIPKLSMTAIQYIPNSRFEDEQNSVETQTGYQGVMVRIDGSLNELEKHLDVAVFNMSSKYPKSAQIELNQYFESPLSVSESDRNRSEAFQWITPYALKNIDSDSIELIGEQQTNLFFRKSISPIERRIAQKTGLYDLRVDYDLGKSLRQRLSSTTSDENLLGVNFIWGLLSDRLLLRLKTDMNTNPQANRDNDLKLTEFELTYLLSQQLSFNFTHISDYNESSEFHPLLSLSFLSWF